MQVNLCPKNQYYEQAKGKCEDCGAVKVCQDILAKCPRECLESIAENALDVQKGLQQQLDGITGWELNNLSIVLIVCIIAGVVIAILLTWLIVKSMPRIIQRIKGDKNRQADAEKGQAGPGEMVPLVKKVAHSSTQTAEKTTETKECQVDKLPTEEIGHTVADKQSEPAVQSTPSLEIKTQEALDNDKPRDGLDMFEYLDQEEAETEVKRPFTEN